MKIKTISLDTKTTIDITLEEPAAREAFFIFGIHKSGSSLLNKLFVETCRILDIPSIPIPEFAFHQGISLEDWDNCSALNSVILDGYCHRGYRTFPLFLKDNELLQKRKKILLVRDPRDAIVSAYFSFAKSHTLPETGNLLNDMLEVRKNLSNMELENFAIAQATNVKEAFDCYHRYLPHDSNLKIYRYEDVIFDKKTWMQDMLNFLNLNLREIQIIRMAKQQDVIPKKEKPSKHIRKVTPGDHKEKLSAECIDKLNHILAEVLERHGYEF